VTFSFGSYQPDARDDILHRAQIGELTPDQAEAEAGKAGIGPLAEEPPLPQFDPMEEPHWTLAMALAWVIWTDPDRVRSYWNDYRRKCWVWRYRENRVPPDGQIQKGWHLEQEKPVSLHDVWTCESSRSPSDDKATSEALDALLKAFQAGKLVATGIPYRQEHRQQIQPHEWIDLSSIDYADGREEAVFSHTGVLRFEAVRVARADVQAIWPSPPSSAKAARDCKAFLIEKMRASPNKRLQSDADLFAEATAKFPRLSERGYRAARSEAIKETKANAWKKAGRPKGQRQ
jgi:hypothetical protein